MVSFILYLKRPPDVARWENWALKLSHCDMCPCCFMFPLLFAHCFTGFGDWHSSYPVHSKEDAWPSLRIAIVGVLQPRTVPQPGPLKLTRFPLRALLQVVLHVVSVLCTANILPLLSVIVIRWKWRAGREREAEREEGRMREEGINKRSLQKCPARLRPLIKEAWQKQGEKKNPNWMAALCPQRGFPSQHALQEPNGKRGQR